jgi:hypothetical protein
MAISTFPTPAAAASPTAPVGGSSLVFSGMMNTGNYTYGSSLAAGTYILSFYGSASGARYAFRAPNSNKTTILISGDTGAIVTTSSETSFNISQSLNGNWTPSQPFGTTNMVILRFGNGLFLAGGGQTSSSASGASWSSVSTGITSARLSFGNGVYVAGGNAGEIKSSTDLITWTGRTSNTATTIITINFGNGLFLYGTANGGLGTSTDGITWTARTSGSTNDILDIGYFNNQYVFVGYNNIRTSPDGTTWTSRTHPFGANSINSIAFGNGVYVATSTLGRIASSTDAITWTLRTSNSTQDLKSITFGNGIFAVCGGGASILTSTDGINWSDGNSSVSSTITLNAIAFGNNTFTAVGSTGWNTFTPASAGYIAVYTAIGSALN